MNRVSLKLADGPYPTSWSISYPIIPRKGDRLLHPHSNGILIEVEYVVIHSAERVMDTLHDADVFCSRLEGVSP